MRTQRSDGTEANTYTYVYNGSQLTQMKKGSTTLTFTYDANGTPVSFNCNGTTYYYTTNIQGDVVSILRKTATGFTVVGIYVYDAWGNCTITGNASLMMLNPLRYRGYVYDQETQLYYLQSRYYNPAVGRFLNADGLVATGQGFVGNNMFAYCGNNPVMYSDPSGQNFIEWIKKFFAYLKTYGETEYGAAREYEPTNSTNQNCLGYVVGVDEICYIEKEYQSEKTLWWAAVRTIKKVWSMGMSIRPLRSYNSPIFANEYRIALKVGNGDYHFMVQHDDGSWSHKPGPFPSRLIEGENPSVVSWDLPIPNMPLLKYHGIYADDGVEENFYTDGPLYFAISR